MPISLKTTFENCFDLISKYFNDHKSLIKQHAIGWGVFYLVDFLFMVSISEEVETGVVGFYISTIIFYILCFYTVVFIFIKFLPNRIWKAMCFTFVVLVVFTFLKTYWNISVLHFEGSLARFKRSPANAFALESWRFSTSILYAFAYWIYVQRMNEQKKRVKTEQLLHKTEIDFLKAQINPHFLFNTLNFVYYDISAISQTSGKAILGLTKLLRYTVESSKAELVLLKKELDAIEEYITLQRVRFGENLHVRFKQEGMVMFLAFPPLILMSIVENAFKYGIIDDRDNPIDIELIANPGNLYFRCRNLIRHDFKDKETTAIGIDNIIRRLDIFYEERYDINIDETEKTYEVVLNVRWEK
jgi:two-component system LytT family sensor kinase